MERATNDNNEVSNIASNYWKKKRFRIHSSYLSWFFFISMRQLLVFLGRSSKSVRFASYSVSPKATISHDWPNPPVPAENVDITIAGGGLVGSAVALAFGKEPSFLYFQSIFRLAVSPMFKNHRIILLESQSKLPKVSKNHPYSNRVCALNSQSIRLFESKYSSSMKNPIHSLCSELGAWDLMQAIRVQKVVRMQVKFLTEFSTKETKDRSG